MTKTLALNEKVILDASISLASVQEDMLAGRIKHDPATKTGRIVVAILGNDEDDRITLMSVACGDFDGNGAVTPDDFLLRHTVTVGVGLELLVLDENHRISDSLAP